MTRVIASFALLGCFWGLVACSTLDQDIDPACEVKPADGLAGCVLPESSGEFSGVSGAQEGPASTHWLK